MTDIPHESGGTAPTADRIVPIPGSHNLRDMGGYRTEDGHVLKWKTLFRSGVMAGLGDDDRAEFRRLGIAAICDLRTTEERERRPTDWHHGEDVHYHSRDYDMSIGSLDEMIRAGNLAREAMHEAIEEVYRQLPFEQADSYRALFRLLIAGRTPLLFNCTAGKDRTGLAAALILYALGVPRDVIEHDYSLTEQAMEKLIGIFLNDPRYAALAALPREEYLPLLRADPAYLALAFDEIERRHGSIPAYLEEVLGVGPAEIERLRSVLLDDADMSAA